MSWNALLRVLHDNLTAAIIAALGTYPVVDNSRTTIRAGCEGGNGGEIMGAPLVPSLLGEFVFRMCHFFSI